MKRPLNASLITAISISSVLPLAADWRDEIGYTRLQAVAGAELSTGMMKGFAQIEAPESPMTYAPDTASSAFSNSTFTLQSGTSGVSSHANTVATNFYGTTTSLISAPAVVDTYEAGDWLGANFLNLLSPSNPQTELRAVQNHSWIASAENLTDPQATEANLRLDYAINRDGFTSVVGANNGSSNPLPQLFEQAYHSISVGLTNGNHSAGFTTLDGTGRIKPDIVAPADFTSFSTPMVASAAGLLHPKLIASPYSLTGPNIPLVTKALLLATATKNQFPSWANTTARPLDVRYGAGQLNVHHAYQTMRAGKFTSSTSVMRKPLGWAAESVKNNTTKRYHFTIPVGSPPTPFSAVLTWHRNVTNTFFDPWTFTMTDLSLRLHQTTGFTLGPILAESLSSVDNVELVHQAALPPGTYALVVASPSSIATNYGLAWHSLPTVSITTADSSASETGPDTATFTLTRTGDTTLPLIVPLALTGTAISGNDYMPLPASVTLPAGQTTTTLTVTPISDSIAQGTRTLNIAAATDFTYVQPAAQVAAITLLDKPYDSWKFSHFTAPELADSATSGDSADADGDSLLNLVEYALALDPKTPEISPILHTTPGGTLTLTATKNPAATDLTWAAEVSADLTLWQPATLITNSATTFEASDTFTPATAPARFIRLKITQP